MAGGRGAVRKTPKKGSSKGSGGQRRRGLEGKGPTPPAHMRETHPAKKRAAKTAEKSTASKSPAGKARPGPAAGEMVVGRNAVVEALRAGVPASSLHVMHRIDGDDRVLEAVGLAADRGVTVLEAGRPELDRITGRAAHQGMVLRVPDYEYAHPKDLIAEAPTPLVVALDGVTDPRNLGAVARSVAAFGGDGLLIPGRRSAGVTAGAWKTSAGTLARVPVARAVNLTRALADYRAEGLFVVGLDGAGDAEVADVELLGEPVVLVVGSEGRGLSRLVRESCDVVARIPITDGAESLNAGVAAGIALYEVSRARRA